MKIAVDIDEVLFEFIKGFMKFIEKEGLGSFDFDDAFSYEFWKLLGITKEEEYNLINKYIESVIFDDGFVVDGAIEGLDYIRKNHEIFFISARPDKLKDKTLLFLKNNFGLDRPFVIFSGEIHKGNYNKESKDEICKRLGVDLIIEDSGKYSLNYASNGLNVLLLNKPWNQGISHEKIVRCSDWESVIENIIVFEKEMEVKNG